MNKLSKKQLQSTMLIVLFINLFYTFTRQIVLPAGNAAWIIAIYVTVAELLVFFVTESLYGRQKDILSLAEDFGGKPFKIGIAFIVSAVILMNMAAPVRSFAESVKMILLQNTPIEVIIITFGICAIIGAYCGIESISIICGLFFPIVAIVLIFFVIMLIPNFEISNLAPIFGTGAQNIFGDGLKCISLFDDILILFFLLPEFEESAIKSGYKAITITGISMCIVLLFYCGVFPYPVSTEYIMPVYQMTRLIEIGDFFGRLEAFFGFMWSISVLLHISVNLYVLSRIWQKTFDFEFYKPVVPLMMIIALSLAFLPSSIVDMVQLHNWIPVVLSILSIIIPLVFGIISSKKEKQIL